LTPSVMLVTTCRTWSSVNSRVASAFNVRSRTVTRRFSPCLTDSTAIFLRTSSTTIGCIICVSPVLRRPRQPLGCLGLDVASRRRFDPLVLGAAERFARVHHRTGVRGEPLAPLRPPAPGHGRRRRQPRFG